MTYTILKTVSHLRKHKYETTDEWFARVKLHHRKVSIIESWNKRSIIQRFKDWLNGKTLNDVLHKGG